MDRKIIPASSLPTLPVLNHDEEEDVVNFSCSVMALDFAHGKSITTIAKEWELQERFVLEAIQSEIYRMCPPADLERYQLAVG